MNLYGFALNNAVDFFDSLGLAAICTRSWPTSETYWVTVSETENSESLGIVRTPKIEDAISTMNPFGLPKEQVKVKLELYYVWSKVVLKELRKYKKFCYDVDACGKYVPGSLREVDAGNQATGNIKNVIKNRHLEWR